MFANTASITKEVAHTATVSLSQDSTKQVERKAAPAGKFSTFPLIQPPLKRLPEFHYTIRKYYTNAI